MRSLPPGTKNLLIVNLIVWALLAVAPAAKESAIMQWCSLHYMGSSAFNPVQIFTYFFLPVSFIPMFFNMLMLFFFGPQIEWAVGTKRFVFYYISCGVGAGLIYETVAILMMNHYMGVVSGDISATSPVIAKMAILQAYGVHGADCAVLALIMAFGVLFAERTIYLMFPPIPLKAKYIAIICVALELLPLLQMPEMLWMHVTPFAGLLVGLGIILYWKKRLKL